MRKIILMVLVVLAINSSAQVHTDDSKLLKYVNISGNKRIYIDWISIGKPSFVHYSVRKDDAVLDTYTLRCDCEFYNVADTVWKESTDKAFQLIAAYLKEELIE